MDAFAANQTTNAKLHAWVAEMDEKGMDGTGLRKRAMELIEANAN